MTEADEPVDEDVPRTTRPALDVLDRDQDRLLYDGDPTREPPIQPLSDGFDSAFYALSWYQAAAIRTLGHVDRVIEPRDMLPLSGLLEKLLTVDDDRQSVYVRRRLVEKLDDACDLAYRQFRERAGERVEDADGETWKDVDPDEESNPLMRPAFRQLDQGQAAALLNLWTGFEDREALGRWVRSLSAPTNGEKPSGLLDEIVASPPLLEALLDQDEQEAKVTRYRFAMSAVMPSFLSAARTLSGGERTDSSGPTHGAFNS
jgi:Trp operon repressor